MNKKTFNINDVLTPNGQFFGFPYAIEEADLILIPVPWDVTTSLKEGTSKGPQAIIDASPTIDFFDFEIPRAWEKKIATIDFPKSILEKNSQIRPIAKEIINKLESGVASSSPEIVEALKIVNESSDDLNDWLYNLTTNLLSKGKKIGLIGGEHSVPYGFVSALADKYVDFGILHIDAHADLRVAYEGFSYSHASIMYNISKLLPISKFVQVGIRDVCQDEMDFAESDSRFHIFSDYLLSQNKFKGVNWNYMSEEIIEKLPEKVYVSFDIDGLDPSLCPSTGTPVPGGLSYNEAVYLLQQIKRTGREVIGFDLCETAPGANQWDEIVAAKLLYQLSILTV